MIEKLKQLYIDFIWFPWSGVAMQLIAIRQCGLFTYMTWIIKGAQPAMIQKTRIFWLPDQQTADLYDSEFYPHYSDYHYYPKGYTPHRKP
jgi:hypothetical protein